MQEISEVEQQAAVIHHNGDGRTPFTQLLDQFKFPQPKRGDILQGEILSIEDDVLYIDVDSKRDAMVPYEELSRLDEEILENLSCGDEVPVYVTHTPVGAEQLLVSLERGLQQLEWERAKELNERGEMIELAVTGFNKGGLEVEFGSIKGFVPNSHVPKFREIRDHKERQNYKAGQIGSTIPLKIIEVDSKHNRFILSKRAAQREQRRKRLHELSVGDVITGKVISFKKYGAFIDIGDWLTGLLHLSNIAWAHVGHPSEKLAVGEEVDVMVESVDIDRERIGLNRKELLPDPWEQFDEAYFVGDLIEGEVTNVVSFGAFVRLPSGIEGLLHLNEMNISKEGHPQDVLRSGDTILVRLIKIDVYLKRIGLSMRRVSTVEETAWLAARAAEEDLAIPDPEPRE